MTEIVFHKVDNLPEKNLSNYIGHIFFTSNGGIYMCKKTEGDTFEWSPFGAVVDLGIIPTYEEILAIAQGKADDVTAEFNGKFGEITKFEDEVKITVGDLKRGLQGLDEKYNGFVSEFAVESENIRGRLTSVENGQASVQTLLSLGLDKSVLRMEGLVNNVVDKSAQMEMTVNGIKTQVENITGMSSKLEQLDNKIEASVTNATSGIEARLTVAEGKIESTVSNDEFESKMSQLPGQINQVVESKTDEVRSEIEQLSDQIQLNVENATTAASIIAKINNDESEVKIKADKINIEGTLTVGEGIGENIEGHDFFRVNSGGSIEARNAIIYGAINAEEGHIGGIVIENGGLKSENDNFNLTAEGKLTANNVVLTGRISADEGYIGDVKIIGGGLRSADGETFRLDGNGYLAVKNASVEGEIGANSGHIGGIVIENGCLKSSNDNFNLTSDGKLTAREVDLTGKIEATSGNIGGIVIEDGGLQNGENFKLSADGLLTVKNANISGTVTADNGTFGCLSIGEEFGRSIIEGTFDEVNPDELEPGEKYYHHSLQMSPEIIDIGCGLYEKKADPSDINISLTSEQVQIGCFSNPDAWDLNGVIDVRTRDDEHSALWTNGVVQAGCFRRNGENYGDPYQEAITSPFKNLEIALVFSNKSHFKIKKIEHKDEIFDKVYNEWYVYVDGMKILTSHSIEPFEYTDLTVNNNIIQSSDGVWQLKWGTHDDHVYDLGCYATSYDKSKKPNTIFITLPN